MKPDIIRRLPKTDLHVHLDGSLRLPTLLELARERKVALPSDSEDGLRALQADHISDREVQRMISGQAIWYQELKNEVGFSFILGQQLLFESGQATLNPKAHPILDRLAQFMKAGLYSIYLDGHTDDVPIRNERFPSNVELSLARAEAVMEYLVVTGGVNPRLFALGGYGSSHPMMTDDTGPKKALNRRVELIFHWNPA